MTKPFRILILIILIQSCVSEKLIFSNENLIIEHKGKIIKENIIQFAINQISTIEYCENFYDWELKMMPNLKYRIVNPKIKVNIISESYNSIGYVIKDKEYEINCNCKKVKALNKKGLLKIYGAKRLPNFIGSISDTLNLKSSYRMEKETDSYLGIESKGYYPTKEITTILFNGRINMAYVTLKNHKLGFKNLYLYNTKKEKWELKERNIRIE